MNLGLSLIMRPRQTLLQYCKVCGQPHDSEERREVAIITALFGKDKYSVCCCCGQEVSKPFSHAYKCRFTRWMNHDTI
jgi:hypothetical protein